MLLAIDIGNTNIVWGVFDGAKLLADWRVGTDQSKTTDEYAILLLDLLRVKGISPDRMAGVILSSVVPPLTPLFEELSETYLHCPPLIVSHELDSGLTIKSLNPREVGSDRIVNAAAAYRRYGGPIIIVDFGTATTFCAVTAAGDYLGGAIASQWRAGNPLFSHTLFPIYIALLIWAPLFLRDERVRALVSVRK